MKKDKNVLSNKLKDSLWDVSEGTVTDFAEVGLDALMKEGLLKDIPILSIANTIYKTGKTIKVKMEYQKLVKFINAMNEGTIDETYRNIIRRNITSRGEEAKKELEEIIVLIESFDEQDKANLLAAFYLAYLDGKITWYDFIKCGGLLKKLFLEDFLAIKRSTINRSDIYMRLKGAGIFKDPLRSDNENGKANNDGDKRTHFGNLIMKCLISYPEIVRPIELNTTKKQTKYGNILTLKKNSGNN